MPNEIVFNLDKNEKVLKLIPIIKDIDNPDKDLVYYYNQVFGLILQVQNEFVPIQT